MAKSTKQMESIVALCKRRGFIFQSSEIYGGIGGFWDYGPLGVELKRNIKDAWWHDMVTNPPTGPDGKEIKMVGLDAAIIMNPKVWEASGHVGGFSDPMVDCKECNGRFRADMLLVGRIFRIETIPEHRAWRITDHRHLLQEQPDAPQFCQIQGDPPEELLVEIRRLLNDKRAKLHVVESLDAGNLVFASSKAGAFFCFSSYTGETLQPGSPCPKCGGSLTERREFNLMFDSHAGAVRDEANKVYLRPETAQGIFVNFKNVMDSTRLKLPFGIAQIGKAFRNEINPRNYTFRSREFEQMEIEFFCHEDDAMMWWEYWRDARIKWYTDLGLAGDNLIPREQTDDELAHYSKVCTDIEYCFPFADEPQELEGVAHRGTYDLGKHQKHSGKDLTYFDDDVWQRDQAKFSKDEAKKVKTAPPYRFLPTVIEPSAGADRSTLAFICEAYTVDESRPSPEVMRFHPRIAPIKAAVFPLVNKDGLPEIAEPIYRELKKRWPVAMDVKASIGKRYARMDEAGTPYCFTVDGQTKEDGTVTVRDRDTGGQERIDKTRIVEFLQDKMQQCGA